ncbi:MAG TPA: EAL domain-containing protein [Chloroflexota bacterium]
MTPVRKPSLALLVLWATIGGGFAVSLFSVLAVVHQAAWWDVLPYLVLGIVAALPTVQLLESQRERFSFSFGIAAVMAAVAVVPYAAPLIGLCSAIVFVVRSRQRRVEKVLFNLANLPLATAVAAATFVVLRPLLANELWPLVAGLAAVLVFYMVNVGVVGVMISVHTGKSVAGFFQESSWSAPMNILLGLTGVFLGTSHGQLGLIGTAMFAVPLLILRITLLIFARKSQQAIDVLQSLNTKLSGEVAQRTAAEAALGESEAHLRAVLDHVAEGIVTVDDQGQIRSCNPAAEQVFGHPAQNVLGRQLGELVPMLAVDTEPGLFAQLLEHGKLLGFGAHETVGRRNDDTLFPIEIAIGHMRQDGEQRFVVSLRDISERQQAAAALAHQALHDALTGLPNRLLLHDRLERAIVSARRDQASVALLVMDLDRFKEVNDTLGHHFGDLLLCELGVRLRSALREVDTVARLGGDEFAVLLPRGTSNDATVAAGRLLEAVNRPFVIEGHPVEVGLSIGIVLCPDHGSEPGALLRRADVAMYVAKRNQVGYATYSTEQDQHSPHRLALMAELRAAIEEEQLELFYQPKIDFRTRRISSVEALVRWRHPQRGLVPPDEFIPLAEQSGQVKALSRWVLNQALRDCRAWKERGYELSVAVNLSMRDLHDPKLPETVAALLGTYAVAPSSLTIEITESTLMADPVQALEIVRALSRMGVDIAIDDFGTGYSSLAYLKRLPVDELKVDRAFVRHIARDSHDLAIVRSTIGLAHDLGLKVVAEGIEDQEAWDRLNGLGCDTAQGFYISRPLPAAALEKWLEESPWGFGHPSLPAAA